MTTKQIVSTPQEAIPVYRWADGSMVYLVRGKAFSASGYTSWNFWAFEILFSKGVVVQLYLDLVEAPFGGIGTLENLRQGKFPITNDTPELSAMLLGFIFDLMGPDYFSVRELIWDDIAIEAFGPRAPEFVSDERWALRHETTMRHGRPLIDDLQIDLRKAKTKPPSPAIPTGPDEPLRFDMGEDEDSFQPHQHWYAEWVEGSELKVTPVFRTKEEAIDNALRRYPVVSESQREEWMATHLKHGAWLIPSPEELEVIRILDARLPFFLLYAELREWLEARGIAMPPEGDGP